MPPTNRADGGGRMRIRPFAGVRRAVGGVRQRLQRQTPLVTSFFNLKRGRWVVQQLLNDLASPLSPLQRVVAVAHLPAVLFLPASFVFSLCVLDFLFLPPKVLLSSVIVVCAVRLWEELQVALLLAALLAGLWSLQRLLRLFAYRWVVRRLIASAPSSAYAPHFITDLPVPLLRQVLAMIALVQHLAIAKTPLFFQAELAVYIKTALVAPALRQQGLVAFGAVPAACDILEAASGPGDGETRRLCLELFCILTRDASSSVAAQAMECDALIPALLSILASARVASPQVASSAGAALANICANDESHARMLACGAPEV
ncbi:hypothetical protein T484DRAFT_1882129, partial [Baffinella frigidus]